MRIQLPKVYPITDTEISGLSHVDQVERLIEGGATLIQLREKRLPARAFYADALAALRLARSARVKLIINDRVDLAYALGADGVHLGQDDMPVEAARKLLGEDAVIGFSTHNIQQVHEALTLPVDYLAFGPIFPTTSKSNPDPVAGPSQLRVVRSLVGWIPIVAIGGINEVNAQQVLNAGADSVALISALVASPAAIADNFRRLVTLLK